MFLSLPFPLFPHYPTETVWWISIAFESHCGVQASRRQPSSVLGLVPGILARKNIKPRFMGQWSDLSKILPHPALYSTFKIHPPAPSSGTYNQACAHGRNTWCRGIVIPSVVKIQSSQEVGDPPLGVWADPTILWFYMLFPSFLARAEFTCLGCAVTWLQFLVWRLWGEARWSWGGQVSSYKVLSSGEVLLLFADEKRLVFFWRGRGSHLLGCKLRRFWAFQVCRLSYPNVPILSFWNQLFEDSDFVKEIDWGCAFSLFWSSANLTIKSCPWFSPQPVLWL